MDDAREFITDKKKEQVCELVHEITTAVADAVHWETLRGLKEEDVAFSLGEKVCNCNQFWRAWHRTGEPIDKTAIRRRVTSGDYPIEDVVDELKENQE